MDEQRTVWTVMSGEYEAWDLDAITATFDDAVRWITERYKDKGYTPDISEPFDIYAGYPHVDSTQWCVRVVNREWVSGVCAPFNLVYHINEHPVYHAEADNG